MIVMNRILYIGLILMLVSCRGTTMKDPPIHLNPNMDEVERVDPQSKNEATYFDGDTSVLINPNSASMRLLVDGTIPRNNDAAKFDEERWYSDMGRNTDGSLLKNIPDHHIVNEKFIMRGKERYNISCSPCHGLSGDGQGIVTSSKFSWNKNALPANFHTIDKDSMEYDGYIYKVISEGYGSMLAYKDISIEDRWKIIAYIRALTYKDKE